MSEEHPVRDHQRKQRGVLQVIRTYPFEVIGGTIMSSILIAMSHVPLIIHLNRTKEDPDLMPIFGIIILFAFLAFGTLIMFLSMAGDPIGGEKNAE